MEERPANAALDDNDLRNAIRGAEGRGLGELNERLCAEFEEFRMDRTDDDVVGVQSVLRVREFERGGRLRRMGRRGETGTNAGASRRTP